MTDSIDIYTLIFMALAVFIIFRLKAVLGERTGHEGPPPQSPPLEDGRNRPDPSEEKIITLPKRSATSEDIRPPKKPWEGFAEEDTPIARTLTAIHALDPSFDTQGFMTGAKAAYEMIVTAFAQGNRRILKPLLSKEVYEGFESSISQREQRLERMETKFIGISKSDLVAAELKDTTASLTVKINAQLITATYDNNNTMIDGSEDRVEDVTDVWTFSRDVTSKDPNWKLVATEEEH